MAETDNPEKDIAALREKITETRKKRMAAQKTVATIPKLELILDRASRDRSTGATDETDALREEIHTLRDGIVHEVRNIDRLRTLFPSLDAEYHQLPPRTRLVTEFNQELQWRDEVLSDERSTQLRIVLPRAEVIS